MSISMCIQDRVPALCSSRFTSTGAKKGFLASKGLQKWKLDTWLTIVESLKWLKTKSWSWYTVFFLKRQSHHWQPLVCMIHKLSATHIQLGGNCAANDMLWFNPLYMHLRLQVCVCLWKHFISPITSISGRVHTLFHKQISRTFPGLRLIFPGL